VLALIFKNVIMAPGLISAVLQALYARLLVVLLFYVIMHLLLLLRLRFLQIQALVQILVQIPEAAVALAADLALLQISVLSSVLGRISKSVIILDG